MPQVTNSIAAHAGYLCVCRDCCDWTEDAVADCWNPAPCIGWICPKCAGATADRFPLLSEPPEHKAPEPKSLPPEPKPGPLERVMRWWRRA